MEPRVRQFRSRFFLWAAFFPLLVVAAQCQSPAETRDDSVSIGTALLQRGLEFLTRESYDSAYSFCDQASRLFKGKEWESYLTVQTTNPESLIAKGNVDSAEHLVRSAFTVAAPQFVPESQSQDR